MLRLVFNTLSKNNDGNDEEHKNQNNPDKWTFTMKKRESWPTLFIDSCLLGMYNL